MKVEIDTLWNVKQIHPTQYKECDWVEIDTLWNVKTAGTKGARGVCLSRNRYIVECKVISRMSESLTRPVEIDTLWNVKDDE